MSQSWSSPIRFYHYWRSSCSWRVRWAIEIKGLRRHFEYFPVNLLEREHLTEEFKKKNPMGLVPAFELTNGQFLAESNAMIEWLEESQPECPSVLGGKNPWVRAQVRQLTSIIASGTQPLQNLGVQAQISEDPAVRKSWAQKWISRGLEAYVQIATRTSGTFSVGDQVTLADLNLIPQLYNARRFEMDLSPFRLLTEIESRCQDSKGYHEAHPDRFAP